jgi:hypothetical protein
MNDHKTAFPPWRSSTMSGNCAGDERCAVGVLCAPARANRAGAKAEAACASEDAIARCSTSIRGHLFLDASGVIRHSACRPRNCGDASQR